MPPDRTFRSQVDLWLVLLVAGAAVLPLVAAGWLASRGETRGVLLLAGWGTTMVLLVGVLNAPLRYTCRRDCLHIQSGWLAWDVPYARLRRVTRSRSPLPAPAWSWRRVRLETEDGAFILVSPDDRESFIEEIAGRCPHLTSTAAGLVVSSRLP